MKKIVLLNLFCLMSISSTTVFAKDFCVENQVNIGNSVEVAKAICGADDVACMSNNVNGMGDSVDVAKAICDSQDPNCMSNEINLSNLNVEEAKSVCN